MEEDANFQNSPFREQTNGTTPAVLLRCNQITDQQQPSFRTPPTTVLPLDIEYSNPITAIPPPLANSDSPSQNLSAPHAQNTHPPYPYRQQSSTPPHPLLDLTTSLSHNSLAVCTAPISSRNLLVDSRAFASVKPTTASRSGFGLPTLRKRKVLSRVISSGQCRWEDRVP